MVIFKCQPRLAMDRQYSTHLYATGSRTVAGNRVVGNCHCRCRCHQWILLLLLWHIAAVWQPVEIERQIPDDTESRTIRPKTQLHLTCAPYHIFFWVSLSFYFFFTPLAAAWNILTNRRPLNQKSSATQRDRCFVLRYHGIVVRRYQGIWVSGRIKDEPAAVPVWVEQEISVEADKRLWTTARWGVRCTAGKVVD